MRFSWFIILLLSSVVTIAIWWIIEYSPLSTEKSPIHIAFAGPMTGDGATAGQLMTQAIQLYFDKINQSGGVGGRTLQLDIYDDYNQIKQAEKQALAITRNHKAVAVIGHWYSSTSIAAGRIYRQYGIPAITPGSTNIHVTQGNPWYFRNIFNANASGQFLANYVKNVLKRTRVSIIHESDAYGAYLAQVFEKEAIRQNIQIQYQWHFNSNDPNLENTLQSIVSDLKTKDKAGVLFLAVQASEGIRLVKHIREQGILNPLISETSFSEQTFIRGFDQFPREQAYPGYYTDDIYVATPLIFDTANEQAQQFYEEFKNRYQQNPDWSAAYAYDTAMVLVKAIEATQIEGEAHTLIQDRRKIRDFLADLNNLDHAIPGLTGFNYFDENRDAQKPIVIGVYKHKNIISALTQLQLVNNLDKTRIDLKSGLEEDRILILDGKYMYKTNVVYTGIKLNGIKELDLINFICELDFDIWFRFQGQIDAANIEFLNAAEPIYPKLINQETVDKITYLFYRVKGRFKADFLSQHHTFKQHILGISFRHRELNLNNLVYVTDFLGMGLTKGQSFVEKLQTAKVLNPTYDWSIRQAWVFQGVEKEDTLGNPKFLASSDGNVQYSKFNAGILIKRNEFSLNNLVSVKIMRGVLLISCIVILLSTFLIRNKQLQQFFNVLWILRVLFAFLLLFSIEVVLVDWLAQETSTQVLEFMIKSFDVLWWTILAILLNRATEQFIWTPLEERTGQTIPNIVRRFVSFLVYLLAFFAVIAFVYERALTSLLATSGVIAMIIGLAIQINISNIFSGIALNLERPLRVGDWVKIGDFEEGKVLDINWRATQLRMRDNSVFTIPNSKASESTIRNFTISDQYFWLWPTVHIDAVHPPERVEKILLDALLSVKSIVKDPKPMVIFSGVNEWSASYFVVVCADDFERKPFILEEVWERVWIHLNRAGINPAIQQHKIHMFRGIKERGEEATHRLTLLKEIDIFQPFSEQAKIYLSNRMRSHQFTTGQTIVQQGDVGDSLFIIVEGVVSVQIRTEDHNILEVARLGAGSFFGEMALLTGQDRTATVVALNDTYLFEIIKADILPLLQQQPEVSQLISKVLTERQLMTKAQMGNLPQDPQIEREVIYKRMLRGIRDFFGLGLPVTMEN